MLSNPYIKNYNSIYRGIVEDNTDPEGLGRCKIRVPSVHGELTYPVSILPWARPLVLSPVGKGKGSVHLPDIGDIVWVFFEGSEKEFPVYLGGTYATGDVEVNSDTVDFYIEGNDKISYNRKTHVYDIKVGDNHIIVSPESIKLQGNVVIEGNLITTGSIIASEDIQGEGISLHSHVHGISGGVTESPQ